MPQDLPPILFLSVDEIRRTKITMKEVIEVVEAVLFQHGSGVVEMAPRTGIYPTNKEAGLPVTTALLLLTAPATGVPLAVMDATLITAMRTGAVTAVAAKFLGR